MSLEAAVQHGDDHQLVGDLQSTPKPERRLVSHDVYALEWAIPFSGSERPGLESLIREYQDLLRAELLQSDRFLDSLLHARFGPQFRSRPDFRRGKLAIEQWVPALDCWMVNGYFDLSAPYHTIVDSLEAGDPRKKTPSQDLEERREAARVRRESNERQSADRVVDAVDRMTARQVENFVAVEQALHTGENITVRGDDRRTIEKLESDTRKAAVSGDREAQSVLTRGQRDSALCVLPTTNPLRHRHRKELEEAQHG